MGLVNLGSWVGLGALDALGIAPGGTLWGGKASGASNDDYYDIFDPLDVTGHKEDQRIDRANDALTNAQALMDEATKKNEGLYGDYYNKVEGTYGDLAGKLNDYLSTFENQEVYQPGQFSFDKNVEDYYSKFANQRAAQAMNALRESSDMFSSDYQDAMAAKQQALASEEWDKAYQRYMQERGQAANEFNMNAQLGQQGYQNLYNRNKDMLGLSQSAQDNIVNAYGNYMNNLANTNLANAQNAANIGQAIAANQNSKKSLLGRILG